MTVITAHRTSGLRVTAVAIAILIAAVLGVAVGTALNTWVSSEDRAATSVFSVDALEAVRITRGDAAASAADAAYSQRYAAAAEAFAAGQANRETDYPLRHAPAAAPPAESFSTQDYADWHRHEAAPAPRTPSGMPQLE